MKKKLALALSMLIATLSAACGSGDATETESDAPAPQAEASAAVTPALLLRTVENIGAELEARLASGTLSAEWVEAWSKAQVMRQQSQVQTLIELLREGATSGDLLAAGSDAIELYLQSYDAVLLEMERQHAEGTLDARLTELRSSWLSVAERVSESGDSSQRASTYCCRASVSFSDNWSCHQFNTIGIWAAAKCSAFFAGVPVIDGIRLSKQSCSDVPECQ
ncbi:hypothetical protein WME75_40290 [Sorangium sp. So ce1014]|uniref:hypothetical protein n=1 Tax=Sorangium sp. So ce1014 TaxID=3133326 RepID=UPI003F63417C